MRPTPPTAPVTSTVCPFSIFTPRKINCAPVSVTSGSAAASTRSSPSGTFAASAAGSSNSGSRSGPRAGQRPRQPTAVAEILDVRRDYPRRLVLDQAQQHLGRVDVSLVAERYQPGQALSGPAKQDTSV